MLVTLKAAFLKSIWPLPFGIWIINESSIECHEKEHQPFSLSGIQFWNLGDSNSSPVKTLYNQRHSRNIYIQNVQLLHTVFCCFDLTLLAKINVNIQDCSRETTSFCHMQITLITACLKHKICLPFLFPSRKLVLPYLTKDLFQGIVTCSPEED